MLRIEGLSKLCGAERYLDDEPLEGPLKGCLWGMTVRSPVSRGRIRDIVYGSGFNWSEFVVVTPDDIPGPNETYLIENDQPVLAPGYVRHMHEPVALIAHADRDLLRRALASIRVQVGTWRRSLSLVCRNSAPTR